MQLFTNMWWKHDYDNGPKIETDRKRDLLWNT